MLCNGTWTHQSIASYSKTRYGVLCGNISVFVVAEVHLNPQGQGDSLTQQIQLYCHTACQMNGIFFISYCVIVLCNVKLTID